MIRKNGKKRKEEKGRRKVSEEDGMERMGRRTMTRDKREKRRTT